MKSLRETRLVLHKSHLEFNLQAYKSLLDHSTKVMVMVKANAYGLGSVIISRLLETLNIDYLGVVFVSEGVDLRKSGITTPIIVFNPEYNHLKYCYDHDLEPVIYDLGILTNYIRLKQKPKCHLNIDTGMNRLGFKDYDWQKLLGVIKKNPYHPIVGVHSHLAAADDPTEDDFTRQQVSDFHDKAEIISDCLYKRPIKHLLNSSGITRWSQYQYDMVRLGVGFYGADSTGNMNLKNSCSLLSRISQIKRIRPNETIGYGRKGLIAQGGKIAIVPAGYGDGVFRGLGNGIGKVLIQKKLCPIVGSICMDAMHVDVSGLSCSKGDDVVLFGAFPTIKDVARWHKTIPYEVLSNIHDRVPRFIGTDS